MDNFNESNGFNENQFSANNNMSNMNGMQNNMQYANNMNGMYNGRTNGYQQARPPIKRTSNGVIVLIIGIIVLFIGLIFVGSIAIGYLAVTAEKEKITINKFKEECEEKALEMQDVTSLKGQMGVDKAYEATNIGENYRLEFYEFDTMQNAQNCFGAKKGAMEIEKSNNGISSSANMKNFAFYSVKANGKYMYVAYVDNTVLYAQGDSDDESEIKEIIDEFDY